MTMPSPNKEFNAILESALSLAVTSSSEYLSIDHLLLAILDDETFSIFCRPLTFNSEYNKMKQLVSSHVFNSAYIPRVRYTDGFIPVRTETVNRIIETAISSAILTHQQTVDVLDLVFSTLSMPSNSQSMAIFKTYVNYDAIMSELTLLLESRAITTSNITKQNQSAAQSATDTGKLFVDGTISQEDLERLFGKGLDSRIWSINIDSGSQLPWEPSQSKNLLDNKDTPASKFGDKFNHGDMVKNKQIKEAEKILKEFCVLLNEEVQNNKITKIIGRTAELREVIQAMGRKQKRNVVLTGDAGTGKSAIVDGLAYDVVNGNVPEKVKNLKIYSMNVASIIAGTKYRGEFEERIKMIVSALETIENSVLFIDEIHTVKGTGQGSDGSLDFANILKPALARGTIRVIGATTDEEYRKFFEKDKALIRRFLRVDVKEPSVAEAKEIISGTVDVFEKYHGVTYDAGVPEYVVDLAVKYIQNRALPDKAFDVIDSVASTKKLFGNDTLITKKDVENEVAKMARVVVNTEEENELTKYKSLSTNVKQKIYGQDHVVDMVTKKLMVSAVGLREANKTKLSALLTGTTGTGKTELCKQIANNLGVAFVRFDMSEYQEKHTVSKLIGAPPGYKGFDDGASGSGALINAIEKNPDCVLLLDEVEKAHPDVMNVLLQVMDYGVLTSSNGKTVSFKNVIVFLTSNVGAFEMEKNPIGFGKTTETDNSVAIASHFAPEFRNRLDVIATFNRLDEGFMFKVVDKFVNELNDQLKSKKIQVIVNDKAKARLVELAAEKKLGARPVNNMITEHIKEPLSELMVFSNELFADKDKVKVTVKYIDNEFKMEVK